MASLTVRRSGWRVSAESCRRERQHAGEAPSLALRIGARLFSAPRVPVRENRGVRLELVVRHRAGAPHLPVLELRRAG